ncbi:MAG: TlpA family protein disulfide reductase [Planctomycetes bacterium]|nr:TlpA family protein disulfide reductase [Planctomycetota bacterium]
MKKSLFVLLAVFIATGIVFAKGEKTTYIKPNFKKKKDVNFSIDLKLRLKRGETDFTQSFQWDYDIVPVKTKSGFLSKAKLNLNSIEYYQKGVYQGDIRAETPEKSDEFSIENNLLKNYLREVPDEKTPKVAYRFLMALTYVYMTKSKVVVGKSIEIPDEVISGLKYILNFKYKSKLKYKIRVKEEIEKKKPVFGVEKGSVIEYALSWRDGDNGIECRGLAIYDSKAKMIAGLKAHGWIKHVSLNPQNPAFTYKITMESNPPNNFKLADNPTPAKYPKAPENKEDEETPSGDLPTAFKVGEGAPAFTLEDLNGKKVSLSDFKGKVILLHTWATTIDKIDDAMTKLYKGIYEKWSSDKLVIISLGMGYKGDTKENQKAYVEKNGIKWITLWDKDRSVTSKYQLKNQFYVALISKEGKAVNWGFLGDKTKDQEMGKYLAEHCSK